MKITPKMIKAGYEVYRKFEYDDDAERFICDVFSAMLMARPKPVKRRSATHVILPGKFRFKVTKLFGPHLPEPLSPGDLGRLR